jgi:TetR/AcrR family transcriptional regulator, regulator of mycofactocin system
MVVPSCYKRRMKAKSPVARRPPKTGAGVASRKGELTVARAAKRPGDHERREGKLPAPSLAQKTQQKRSELMICEVEAVALAMFESRGFAAVNVEEIAVQARISTRTFYRYFPTKEDVLQVRIRREAEALREALAERPADELPLHSLRLAVERAVSAEDPILHKRWIGVVAATPSALRAVLGGCILLLNGVLAEFFGSRLSLPADALVPTMLAAAASGVIKAAETHWVLHGGNLATIASQGLGVLEEAVGTGLGTKTWDKSRGRYK